MIAKLSKQIADYFSNKQIIDSKDIPIYAYGYEILISEMLSWFIILVLSIVTKHFFETIIYMVTFMIMRQNSGGYHAKSHRNCILIFITVYIIFIAILYLTPTYLYRTIILFGLIINMLLMYFFAPADSENKPFTSLNEIKKYRKGCLSLNITFTIISFLSILFTYNITKFGYCIMLGLITVGISVAVSKVRVNIC